MSQPYYCYQLNSCSSCAGVTSTYNGLCGWCSYNNQCTSTSSCNGGSIVNSNSCPVNPTTVATAWSAADALGTLSIGVLAVIILAVLIFSPVEKLCGRRAVSTISTVQPRADTVFTLFVASTLQWLGVCLILAAPIAPWIIVVSDPYDYLYANAFNAYNCQIASPGNTFSGCFVQPLDAFTQMGADTNIAGFVNSGQALGGLALAFAVSLLIPAALMTSVATYRLSLLENFGVLPYTVGCSLASLTVVQMLAWPGFVVTSILWFCALALCSKVVTSYPMIGSGSTSSSFLPGEVLLGLGIAFTAVGLIIVSIIARREARIRGVGCNMGGCCVLTVEASSQESWEKSTGLLNGDENQQFPSSAPQQSRESPGLRGEKQFAPSTPVPVFMKAKSKY